MTPPTDTYVEPTASAPPQAWRRYLKLAGLFLAGPAIWITYFMAVYLAAEAMCAADVDVRLLGLPLVATVTVITTALAAAATLALALVALRRWKATRTGSVRAEEEGPERPGGEAGLELESHPDADLAFAGFLLGLLFVAAALFVGLPALVLQPC